MSGKSRAVPGKESRCLVGLFCSSRWLVAWLSSWVHYLKKKVHGFRIVSSIRCLDVSGCFFPKIFYDLGCGTFEIGVVALAYRVLWSCECVSLSCSEKVGTFSFSRVL
jgi:hypothetical protein